MKAKEMIKENNTLREQMTPFNRSYFEDMIIAMRASRVDSIQAEELLLDAAKHLLREQRKGKNAKQTFGEKPEDYFREIMSSNPARPIRSKLNYYFMIPTTALTCFFGILAIAGLLSEWSSGSTGIFGKISLFTIIAVGVGSIILIELLMRWMKSLADDDAPKPKSFDIKGLGIYIGIVVIAVFAGKFLDALFPIIIISPWVSLILCLVGGGFLKFIFLKK
ncbi:DUF1129 family protein [Paenibacillus sp. 19GGS1-52]|uniref:DUF1129 family protein n=1 Tax=Paenibacillus sp. 19GGS1-52 TaxID=2758563 RepID=UPI001EFA833C|nr:DUF1129 family protein [Paenibacillus sp. 19GGS1-52]ULO06923.1 DUF1129 family protein [Paenibacillus sp. 19GGS1-52]